MFKLKNKIINVRKRIYGSCYEVLDAGQTYDALIDMSGGIQEQFDLKVCHLKILNIFFFFKFKI